MPKRYAVTPRPDPNGKGYIATFRDASGRRVTRGLRTRDETAAKVIAAGLVHLRASGARKPSEAPSNVDIEAVRLYFGEGKLAAGHGIRPDDAVAHEAANAEVDALPKPLARVDVLKVVLERNLYRRRAELAEADAAAARGALASATSKLEALERSAIGRQVKAAERVPGFDEALRMYEEHLRATTTDGNARAHVATARAFAAGCHRKTPLDVTVDDLAGWLDAKVNARKSPKPLEYRRGLHIKLARFVNWSAERFGYPSQMAGIAFPAKVRLDRERGDIVWHTKAEVEKALRALPSDYWRALVATLAYGGLQLAELCWLRKEDLDLRKGTLRVTVVEVDGARHALKTGHRVRTVNLDRKLLLPRLKAHVAAGGAGAVHLFPMAGTRKRTRAKAGGAAERWVENTLSARLRGYAGAAKRPAKAGLLPPGMNALTLRHTAGSLLLRSGATVEEVAAFLGNTPEVCRSNYARILGSEVKVKL